MNVISGDNAILVDLFKMHDYPFIKVAELQNQVWITYKKSKC